MNRFPVSPNSHFSLSRISFAANEKKSFHFKSIPFRSFRLSSAALYSTSQLAVFPWLMCQNDFIQNINGSARLIRVQFFSLFFFFRFHFRISFARHIAKASIFRKESEKRNGILRAFCFSHPVNPHTHTHTQKKQLFLAFEWSLACFLASCRTHIIIIKYFSHLFFCSPAIPRI